MTDASEAFLFPYRRSVHPYVNLVVGRVCSRRVRIVAYARSRPCRRQSDVRVVLPWSKIPQTENFLGNVHEDDRRRKLPPGHPRRRRVLRCSFHPTKRNRIKISVIKNHISLLLLLLDNNTKQEITQPKFIYSQN